MAQQTPDEAAPAPADEAPAPADETPAPAEVPTSTLVKQLTADSAASALAAARQLLTRAAHGLPSEVTLHTLIPALRARAVTLSDAAGYTAACMLAELLVIALESALRSDHPVPEPVAPLLAQLATTAARKLIEGADVTPGAARGRAQRTPSPRADARAANARPLLNALQESCLCALAMLADAASAEAVDPSASDRWPKIPEDAVHAALHALDKPPSATAAGHAAAILRTVAHADGGCATLLSAWSLVAAGGLGEIGPHDRHVDEVL